MPEYDTVECEVCGCQVVDFKTWRGLFICEPCYDAARQNELDRIEAETEVASDYE